jgi:hypothetical protein
MSSIDLKLAVTEDQLEFLVDAAGAFDELHGLLEALKKALPQREGRRGNWEDRDIFVHPQSTWC